MLKTLQIARSQLFTVGFYGLVVIYATLGVLTYPLTYRQRYRFLTSWCDVSLAWLKLTCNISYRVEGLENIPNEPSVVMANHQSTFETLVLKRFFPPMVWVVKQELLWIPFFGWGLALSQPIALARKTGRKAADQLVAQARARLRDGLWIILFPEGTRIPHGQERPFKQGGGRVASETAAPIVPVAHNAGRFWPRRAMIKHPGVITIHIGPPIRPDGKSAKALTDEAQAWIQAEVRHIDSQNIDGSRTPSSG